jgi:hypothetical protein
MVLLVLVVALALLASGLCWAAIRRIGRARRAAQRLAGRLEEGRPGMTQRLIDGRARAIGAVAATVALGERLSQSDAAMAATSLRLRDGRGSIDEATRERLLPLARWFSRVVAISRLWRMQREMWQG